MRVPYPLTFPPVRLRLRALPWALVVTVVAAAVGCQPPPEPADALAALSAETASERYDGLYWRVQHRRDPDLFARAVGYCREEEQAWRLDRRPNCVAVLRAQLFARRASRQRARGLGFTGLLSKHKRARIASKARIAAEGPQERSGITAAPQDRGER